MIRADKPNQWDHDYLGNEETDSINRGRARRLSWAQEAVRVLILAKSLR